MIEREILNKIEENDSIIITRHIRPDSDALGSTLALREILRDSYPEKNIKVINSDFSPSLSFLGEEDKSVDDCVYKKSLIIVLDTATMDRVSNKKIGLSENIIKIDHHPNVEHFGTIEWVEDFRSSASEMISSFAFNLNLKVTKKSATLLYSGIVADSGDFRYSSVSPQTFRIAASLLEKGVDIEMVNTLLALRDYDYLKFTSFALSLIKKTKHGVLYMYVDQNTQKEWKLTREEASDTVDFMANVKGCICWLSFIENEDKTIRVRLRSRFMRVDEIASSFHGGGHDKASGATCYTKKEMKELIKRADEECKKYKIENTDWK